MCAASSKTAHRGDMVFDVNEPVNAEDKIIDPSDLLRQKSLAGLASETLLRRFRVMANRCSPPKTVALWPRRRDAKEALGKLERISETLAESPYVSRGSGRGHVASPCGARGGASWPKIGW